MADTKKAPQSAEKMVTVKLRKLKDPNASQQEFYSYNFQNYIIKRGEEVEIPEGLWLAIQDNEDAEDFALTYAEEKALKEPK